MLRTSERSTFRRCHHKWWLEFEDRIKPSIDVPPLRFGTLIHGALGAYYKPGIRRGPHPALTFEQLYEADLTDAAGQTREYSKPEIDQIWSTHRDLGISMLTNYIGHYGKDDEWRVIVTEYPFRTIVQHPVRGTPWFWYTGIIDGLWEHRKTKRKVIPDHKSTKSITLQYLQMDDQATAYWTWGFDALVNARLVDPQEKIDGMLFNFLRKAKKDERPQDENGQYLNKDGSVSKKQPSAYFARVPIYRDFYEREGARQRILIEWADMERIRLAGRDHQEDGPPPEAYKNPSQFTCMGCWAFDMCELHEIGQDWTSIRDLTTRTWDPYSAHEIQEGR
jgi:hypothetical protein